LPCSALDPIATQTIAELIIELMKNFTINIVTHSISRRRASRTSPPSSTGKLIEYDKTRTIHRPRNKQRRHTPAS
jgi:phosphate transport system ATP-binding protein